MVATRISLFPWPSGYVLVPLRASADFTLYRGRRYDDPSPVLAIALSTELRLPQSISRLEHEYAFAVELDPAWAAKPLPITHDVRQPMHIGQIRQLSATLSHAIDQAHGLGLTYKDTRT